MPHFIEEAFNKFLAGVASERRSFQALKHSGGPKGEIKVCLGEKSTREECQLEGSV